MENWTSVGTRDQIVPDEPFAASVGETKIGVYEVDV